MRGKNDWFPKGRWSILFRRFYIVIFTVMFIAGPFGWVKGWGANIKQDVTKIEKQEADIFSSPILVTGMIELLAHKWFDYDRGSEKWKDIQLDGTLKSQGPQDYQSKVIVVAIQNIKKTGDHTAEVTASVLREVSKLENGITALESRSEQIRVPLLFKNGELIPQSGPIIEKNNIRVGVNEGITPIQLDPLENEYTKKLADGYVSAMSSGNKEQIGYLFKKQSSAPSPVAGTLTLLSATAISKNGNKIVILLKIRQKESTGLSVDQVHRLETEMSGDRLLITNLTMGGS